MKTFCGILLCCLDAPAFIKRNGNEFHDFLLIVKYAHFHILLLLLFFFLFHTCRAYTEWALSLKTAKLTLKYSYPTLTVFIDFFFYKQLQDMDKNSFFLMRSHKVQDDAHCQNFSGKDTTPKRTQPFLKSYCKLHLTLWNFFLDVRIIEKL